MSNNHITDFNNLNDNEKDLFTVNIIKGLVIDGVRNANSGHPGGPMSLADFTYILYSEFLTIDPKNPDWENRDRVVLSCMFDSSKSKLPSSPIGRPKPDSDASAVDHLREHVSTESWRTCPLIGAVPPLVIVKSLADSDITVPLSSG